MRGFLISVDVVAVIRDAGWYVVVVAAAAVGGRGAAAKWPECRRSCLLIPLLGIVLVKITTSEHRQDEHASFIVRTMLATHSCSAVRRRAGHSYRHECSPVIIITTIIIIITTANTRRLDPIWGLGRLWQNASLCVRVSSVFFSPPPASQSKLMLKQSPRRLAGLHC
jgi:hypothetical protein